MTITHLEVPPILDHACSCYSYTILLSSHFLVRVGPSYTHSSVAVKPYTTSTTRQHIIMAEQQVQLTDLNLQQLQEVKRQLDEVSLCPWFMQSLTHHEYDSTRK